MASADVDRYQVLMCKNFIDLLQLVGVAMNKLIPFSQFSRYIHEIHNPYIQYV